LGYLVRAFVLLGLSLLLCCVIYPIALWWVGHVCFPWQAHGSRLVTTDGTLIGSTLIAQPFQDPWYFHPRPSAAAYNAAASASSALAPSNSALRARVVQTIGPIVRYSSGPKAHQLVAPDLVIWFQQDVFQGKPHLVAQWALAYPLLAAAWVQASPLHTAYVQAWMQQHALTTENLQHQSPAVLFFQAFSQKHPGYFPSVGPEYKIQSGQDITSLFFEMWLQDHPEVSLESIPGDLVMTSASGLDPHISLEAAYFQVERVAQALNTLTHQASDKLQQELEQLLEQNATAPLGGLVGEKYINVLELNLVIKERYKIF